MARPRFIIVLDDNLNHPKQWQASAEADTLEEARAIKQHDAECWVVGKRPKDVRRKDTILTNKFNGQKDRGGIYELEQ
jgi:hypothetical protein